MEKRTATLARRLRDQFQSDRCMHHHATSLHGVLLHQFLRLIQDWAESGFPAEAFVSTQPPAQGSIVELAFRSLLEHVGKDEIEHLLDNDDYLLSLNDAPTHWAQVGGPRTLEILAELIYRHLDYWYLGVQGDYAVVIAEQLTKIKPTKFGSTLSDKALAELWVWSGGANWCSHLAARQNLILEWVADKPTTDRITWPPPQSADPAAERQLFANPFVVERLGLLQRILPESVRSAATLNGGAYPRGGRKPPSRTHGTTYGLDLDCGVQNVESLRGLGKDAKSIFKALMKHVSQPIRSPYTRFGQSDFGKSVTFTQALLLTFPSRLYFGDYLALIAAFGGLYDTINAGRTPVALTTYIKYEPVIHYNHWHVDWLPQAAIAKGRERTAPAEALFVRDWQESCKNREKEEIPIRTRAELVRPLHVGPPLREAPTLDEVESVLTDAFGYGTEAFQLPLGPVQDEASLKKWVDRFFFRVFDDEEWIH